MGATCTKTQQGPPEWNSGSPLQIGCDKQVFVGTFGSKRRRVSTVIHVPTEQGESQFQNELSVLLRLGAHPHILSLIQSGVSDAGSSYMALEDVQCELHSVVKYYMFAKQNVPGPMATSVAVDLSHAIDHMHSKGVVHRDIKVESVLLTKNHDAKLVDMGMACRLGLKEERWIWHPKEYRALEICCGNRKMGPEVDCWGIGIVLHQMYQFRWDIVDASDHEPRLRPCRPSIKQPMDPQLLQAMMGLLDVNTMNRWTTKNIQEHIPVDRFPGYRDEWMKPIPPEKETRKFLCRYRHTGLPINTYVAVIDSKAKHLFGKTVDQIGIRRDDNVLLLLVDRAMETPAPPPRGSVHERAVHERSVSAVSDNSVVTTSLPDDDDDTPIVEKVPNKDTVITEGCWLYFGLPHGKDTEATIVSLERKLFPAMCKDKGVWQSIFIKPLTFALEFDCFRFPDHVPAPSIIGQSRESKAAQLSIRRRFGLNLAGIVKRGTAEPEIFPGNLSKVGPGDLGLVLRWPRPGGRSEATITDEQLAPLMSRESFCRIMAEEPIYPEDALIYNI